MKNKTNYQQNKNNERKPYVKPSFVTFASIAALSLASCNSGSSSGNSPSPVPSPTPIPSPTPTPSPDPKPTPTPTPSPTPYPISQLQEFINSLTYSPNVISTANQSSFTINSPVDIESIQISFYKDSVNCSSGLNNVINLNGNVSLRPGIYTTSNYSNFYICQKFSGGCNGLLSAVEAATAWSMQYTYYFASGTSYQSVCMINTANPIGKSAEFFANYTTGLTACTAGNSCEFSQAYSLPLGWSTQNGGSGGTTVGVAIKNFNVHIYTTGTTTVGLSGQLESSAVDTYIAKYTESGTILWLQQFGAGNGTPSYGIGVDDNSNSYVVGYTYGALPGQIQTGIKDYYITKYDPNGNMIWIHQVGSAGQYCPAYDISTNATGDSYITGTATGALTGQTQTGNEDYFVAKYDTDGDLIWTRQVGAAGGLTRGLAITTDIDGNSYITGYTTVGLSGQTQTGTRDYFITKYDKNGNLIWTRQVGAAGGTTSGSGIYADSGNIYITGYTSVGISGQTQTGTRDYFVTKYDTNGNLIWTRQVGAAGGTTSGSGIYVDSGSIYVTGYTSVGISGQTQTGLQDYYIAEYDTNGNLLSTNQMGAVGGRSGGRGIIHANQNSYVTGTTNAGLSGQNLAGVYDYFISKVPD